MAGDEIDGVMRLSATLRVEGGGPAEALGEDARVAVETADEVAGIVPEPSVPLSPLAVVGEVANLVKAAGIPSLSDQLDLAEYGVVGDGGNRGGSGRASPTPISLFSIPVPG